MDWNFKSKWLQWLKLVEYKINIQKNLKLDNVNPF